jgi:hypothetical protein
MPLFIQFYVLFLVVFVAGCAEESASIGASPDGTLSSMNDQLLPIEVTDTGLDSGTELDAQTQGDDATQPPLGPSTIQRIQQGELTDGTSVTIIGAVVTAVAGRDGFFISDGTAQPYSGIYVYHPNTHSLSLEPGQIVTLVGVVKEYFDLTEIVLNPDAEVLIDGMSLLPDSVAVAAEVFCDPAALEPWEGMLISVDNLLVQSIGEFSGFVAQSRSADCEISINPLIAPITLGRLFSNQNIARVTGVLHYAHQEFQLLPRGDEDIITVPLATGVVQIAEIRDGDVPHQSRISIQGVSVLAVDGFFVYLGDVRGGPRSAIRVTDRQRDTAFSPGDRVDVDVMVMSNETARMIQGRVTGQAIGPRPIALTDEQLESEEYLYGLVSVQTVVVVEPNPTIRYVDEQDSTSIYGNPKADFELDRVTVGNEFFQLEQPFLRAGDRFEEVIGVRTTHRFEVLENEQVVEVVRAAIAPRQGSDFIGYAAACDGEVCIADLDVGDLVITEISYGGTCEWIEVKNTREQSIDLTGVQVGEQLSSTSGVRPFTFGNDIIQAGSLAVLGCAPNCGEPFVHIESTLGGALANDGDTIELWAGELTLDTVTYVPARTDGIQLLPGTIMGHPGREIAGQNDDPNYWCDALTTAECGSVGTPGQDNQCSSTCLPNRCAGDMRPGDILITELMTDPVGGSSECEWIELYNNTDQVLELAGLLLVDGAEPNFFRAPNLTAGVIEPRSWAVVMKDAEACVADCKPPSIASWRQFASLNNGEDTITIVYQDRVIDQVSYFNASTNGATVQRIGLDDVPQWCAAIDGMDACAPNNSTPNQANECR